MLATGPAPDPRTACTLLQHRAADRELRAVSGYAVNDGADRPRRFEVDYRDGRYHRLGRGVLGFGERVVVEVDRIPFTKHPGRCYSQGIRSRFPTLPGAARPPR
ncbi:hypothetical protein WME99_40320 [Sorangium sp. So ce136]|uniref:hypothetical protein n=1 Tax=Sorangium sp. So ce136 TaxID=3133284 RepID=UPI003F0882E6